VAAWQASVMADHPLAENIEVPTSHTGMASHPAVLHAVGDRLAQHEGQWQPSARRPASVGLRRHAALRELAATSEDRQP